MSAEEVRSPVESTKDEEVFSPVESTKGEETIEDAELDDDSQSDSDYSEASEDSESTDSDSASYSSEGTDESEDDSAYLPVFNIAKEVPEKYYEDFCEAAIEHEQSWVEITSDEPDFEKIMDHLEKMMGVQETSPFIGWTVEKVYDFYKAHVRPDENLTEREGHFTAFAFAVIDEECLKADPPQVILCSDAPDFDESEGEVKLKQIRLPLMKALEEVAPIDDLSVTPSEVEKETEKVLTMRPPPTLMSMNDPENPDMFRAATSIEARQNKRKCIIKATQTLAEKA